MMPQQLRLIKQECVICNKRGLHARASAKFVQLVERYCVDIEVEKDGLCVSGLSIMGLMMLAASCGSSIIISASGAQADEALYALNELIANKFGEEE